MVLFSLILEEPDDFYDFTAEDYYRLMATKKEGNNQHVEKTTFVFR